MQSAPFVSSVFPVQNSTFSSRWLPVAPCGLGTPLQESLPSYLNRLARAHSLPVTTFLSRELSPLLNPDANYRSVSNYLGRASRYLLLGDGLASRVAVHVAQLTLIPQVTKLVPGHIAENLGWTRDIRDHVAWCPLCFREWDHNNKPIYFPLSWAFKATRCCLIHGVVLRDACGGCGGRFSHLTGHTWKGKCFECRRSFAEESKDLDPSALDVRCTQLVDSLLGWAASVGAQSNFSLILRENLAAAAAAIGGAKTLSRVIGRSPAVVGFWLRRKQNPTLSSLLRLSLAFRIPLEQWLSVALDRSSFLTPGQVPKDVVWLSDRECSLSAEHVEKALRNSLSNNANPPPSLFALANSIPASLSRLYRSYPDLAARIVERHRLYCSQRKAEYATKLDELIRTGMSERRSQGLSVTADSVLTQLGSRWALSRRRLRVLFRELQRAQAVPLLRSFDTAPYSRYRSALK